jgi:TrmH family RNA methyltransferase
MKRITSRHNALVARYRDAARGKAPGLMLLDGAHLVTEAAAAGIHIEHAAMSAADASLRRLAGDLERHGTDVVLASASVMDALSPVRSSSAVVALAARPSNSPNRIYGANAALVVIAAAVQDPGNVGAMIRVAEAGGATGFVATTGTADPFGWKALRGSMGSALRLPVRTGVDPVAAVGDAKAEGCRIVAATPRGGPTLYETDLRGPSAVLIGSEGTGLPTVLETLADVRVSIPMRRPVESLNAAVTAALIVYEAQRQRMTLE